MPNHRNFPCYKENELPDPISPPTEYMELSMKQPFGQGSYRLKYNIIRKSKETTLIEAYSRLVRVWCKDGIHWQTLDVAPYTRRIPTHYIE